MEFWHWILVLIMTIAVVVAAVALHERSVRKRFREAQADALENRGLDKKIFRLYTEIEEMLDSFEEYVREVHEDLEIRREELLSMSRQATSLYAQIMQPNSLIAQPAIPEPPRAETPETAVDVPQNTQQAKTEKSSVEEGRGEAKPSKLTSGELAELEKVDGKAAKIRFLTTKGLTLNEIARELKMGKGEINLILDLDK